jgi:hypothetical protein
MDVVADHRPLQALAGNRPLGQRKTWSVVSKLNKERRDSGAGGSRQLAYKIDGRSDHRGWTPDSRSFSTNTSTRQGSYSQIPHDTLQKEKTKLQPPASLAEEANREHLISRVHYAVVYLHLPLRPPELTNPAEIWRPPNNTHHTQTWHQRKHKA